MACLRNSLLLVQLFDINEKQFHFSYLKKSNVIVTGWMVVFWKLDDPTECNSLLVLISSATSSLVFSNISVHMVYSVIEGISVNKHESIYYLTNHTSLKSNPYGEDHAIDTSFCMKLQGQSSAIPTTQTVCSVFFLFFFSW